jgi:ABC-type uncharacterized transport system auxiliary subunit
MTNVRRARDRGWILCAAIALLSAFGCGGKVPATHYYLLDYEVPPATAADSAQSPLEIALGIEPFSTQPVYRDRRIAYRVSDHEVVYYPYRYWAAAPGDLVAEQLAQHIRRSHVVSSVEVAPYGRPPDWVISGHVAKFEQVKAMARLDLTVRLESVKTGELLWEDTMAAQKPITGHDADQIAGAMSRAMLDVGADVVARLRAEGARQAAAAR